eukprot:TRINITY_DN5079_c0_g1_i1.p1 TRINITY_DN5079_c0_g1~~TRINITY_DN5079_c0_g1_i1.p1  ORF type:complete len:225 (+),score=46.73 TRINITY_DN5079_c0_g1_i1:81-677(+)
MIIILTEKQKADLAILSQIPSQVIPEFFKLSMQFIRSGSNKSLFVGAAKQLSIDVNTIAAAVESLSYLFTQSAKSNINEIDFVDSLISLPFDEEQKETLKSLYLENKAEVRSILGELSFELPKYHNLDWRLDVTLASRAMRNIVEPVYILRLETKEPEMKVYTFECNFNNLKFLVEELEMALNQTKTAHCRRIMRNIK